MKTPFEAQHYKIASRRGVLVLAIGLFNRMLAAVRRTGTIVKAMTATRAAVGHQRVTKSSAGAVETHIQCPGLEPEVSCHNAAILVVDVNSADQVCITRAQFGDQPFDAVADYVHIFDRVIRDNGRLSLQCNSLL